MSLFYLAFWVKRTVNRGICAQKSLEKLMLLQKNIDKCIATQAGRGSY
jgi:hypothetical protein